MTHEDIYQILPDYVLGLLPANYQNHLERHLAQCPECREAVARERNLTHLLRSTIAEAAKPDTLRLQALMPAIPQKKKHWPPFAARWQTQLAPIALILAIIFVGLFLKTPGNSISNPLMFATSNVATATSTHTPTATLAQTVEQHFPREGSNGGALLESGQVVLIEAPSPKPALYTPAPQPTPVPVHSRLTSN